MKIMLRTCLAALLLSAIPVLAAPSIPLFHVNGERWTIDADAFARAQQQVAPFTVPNIVLPDGEHVTLDVRPFRVTTSDAVLIEVGELGERAHDVDASVSIRGTVRGWPGSSVTFTVFAERVWGYIERVTPSGRSRYVIENGSASLLGERTTSGFRCFAEDIDSYQRRADSIFALVRNDRRSNDGGAQMQNSSTEVVEVATECSQSFFTAHGGTLSESSQYAIALMSAVSSIYERDANVAIRVPFLRIWTVTDPYPGDIGAALGEVRDVWERTMQYVRRSTTVLLSNSVGGGLAWVGTLCSGYGYCVCGVGGAVNFPAGAGYIWDLDVTSHELGHNIGSAHTHNCGWAPAIDSCWNAEGGCYDGTKPRPGSIMAYCHLTPFGNQLLFHPRVASLLRAVTENRSCTAPTEGLFALDAAAIYIELPVVGGAIGTGQLYTPRCWVVNRGTSATTPMTVRYIQTAFDGSAADTVVRTVSPLNPGEKRVVVFDERSVNVAGQYLARCEVALSGDQFATNDQCTRPFEVTSSIEGQVLITSPKGAEIFTAGDTTRITWTSTNVKNVRLDLTADNGATWSTIRTVAAAADGAYTWPIPAVASAQCRIRISAVEQSSIRHVMQTPFTIQLPRDAQAIDFVMPATNDTATTPMTPRVVVHNNGSQDLQNVAVTLQCTWAQDANTVYDQTITVPVLRTRAQDTVSMSPSDLLAEGVHTMLLRVHADGDLNVANDEIGRSFIARGTSPPVSFRVVGGHQRAILQWERYGTSSVTAWEIYRRQQGAEAELIATVLPTVMSYVDVGLVNETTYTYTIRARNGQQRSVASRERTVTPRWYPAGFRLVAPRITSPSSAASALPLPITLAWNAVNGAVLYQVQMADDAGFARVTMSAVVDHATQLALDIAPGTTKYCRVRCFNNSDNSPWSATRSVTANGYCAGSALSFGGKNGVASNESFSWPGGPVTVEFWIKVPKAALPNATAFAVGDPDDSHNRFQTHCPWSDGNLYWDYGDLDSNGRLVTSFAPYLDRWTHVALVSNGQTFSGIYLNGVLVKSSAKASAPRNRTKIFLGMNVAQWPSNGIMDDVRIWSRVRTADEIAASMRAKQLAQQSGLVAWWKCDDATGTTVRSSGSVQYALTMSGDVSWVSSDAPINCTATTAYAAPKLRAPSAGQQISVMHDVELRWDAVTGADRYDVIVTRDATNDSVICTAQTDSVAYRLHGLEFGRTYTWKVRALSGLGTGPWSTSTFSMPSNCRPRSLRFDGATTRIPVDTTFVFNGPAVTVEFWNFVGDSDLQNSIAFSAGPEGRALPRFQAHAPWGDKKFYWDCGDPGLYGRVSADYTPYLNQWTHVALTSNGRDRLAIYFNGTLAASTSAADSLQTLTSLIIGARSWENLWHRGSIDNFRIWNVERTQQQIAESMFRVLTDAESGLLGSWPMKEGAGSFIYGVGQAKPNEVAGALDWRDDTKLMHRGFPDISGAREAVKGVQYLYHARPSDGRTATWRCVDCDLTPVANGSSTYVTWNAVGVHRMVVTSESTYGCADSSWVDVNVVLTSDAHDTDAHDALMWSPTPTHDEGLLQCPSMQGPVRIDLVDGTGSWVRTVLDAATIPEGPLVVRTSDLPSGVYHCIVRGGNETHSCTIVVVH